MASIEELIDRGNEAFNRHDAKALGELYADDVEFRGPGDAELRGREQVVQFMQSWFDGFPDMEITVETRCVQGDTVCEEGIARGTHRGVFKTPMGDIPPTGRRIEGRYVDTFVVRGDRVVSDHLMFDRLQLLEQLGLAPAPAGATA